jgi:hypothetical protein
MKITKCFQNKSKYNKINKSIQRLMFFCMIENKIITRKCPIHTGFYSLFLSSKDLVSISEN